MHQAEKELDLSLDKLRSVQLVTLQRWALCRDIWHSWDGSDKCRPSTSPGTAGTPEVTWVTCWLCCVIMSITWALSNLDVSAAKAGNPSMSAVKAGLAATPHVCNFSCLLNYLPWWIRGVEWARTKEEMFNSALNQGWRILGKNSQKYLCFLPIPLSDFFLFLFFPPSFTQSSVFGISCLQAALCFPPNLRLWLSHVREKGDTGEFLQQ